MGVRGASTACAAAVLFSGMSLTASAQVQTSRQATDEDGTPITLVGCLQRESDYRRANDSGRGGVAGTGVGRGNEYVLINASQGSETAELDCSSPPTGEAYELTGSRERDLERFVGRAVQIDGMLKRAETEPVGTTGQSRPTGGIDPLGQDLRLHEVNVTSFQEPTVRRQARASQGEPAAPAASQQAPAAEREPAATTGEQQELPRTASPVPAFGLLGLLSLGAAAAVRLFTRRG